MIELVGQFGIDLALIQRRSAGRKEYDTAWTLNVLIGAGIAAIVAGAGAQAAALMNEARVETILYWLAGARLIKLGREIAGIGAKET